MIASNRKDYDLYGFADVEASVLAIRPEGMVFNVTEDKTDGGWIVYDRLFAEYLRSRS